MSTIGQMPVLSGVRRRDRLTTCDLVIVLDTSIRKWEQN
jgi:hypothetical protein